MRQDTIFDLASLTKPLATSVAVMTLVNEGRIRLDEPVARVLPAFGGGEKEQITCRHLLSHCSGLAAWRPYYREVLAEGEKEGADFSGSPRAREIVYRCLDREELAHPPGEKAVYSDLGFILVGRLVELASGRALDEYCEERVFRPLGLADTAFVPLGGGRRRPCPQRFAPTEVCPWRKKLLCGEVHDDTAWIVGGVAGHAGLFATAGDVDRLVAELTACYRGAPGFLPAAVVREFWTRSGAVSGSTWALGWDTPSRTASSAGRHFSASSVGHLGFTGTSVWVDLEREVSVVLLTNRVHPRRNDERIKAFRPVLHDLVMETLLAA